jgi:hypothetical protein
MTLKPRPRLAGNPLPRRNRKENLMKRIASRLPDQAALNAVLAQQPTAEMRGAWLKELRPYLRFTPQDI